MNDSAFALPAAQKVWDWLLTHAGLLLCLMLLQAAVLYRQELKLQLVDWLRLGTQWLANQQLHQKVAADFMIKHQHQQQTVSFVSLLRRDTLVLVFTPGCRACEQAILQLSRFDPHKLAAANIDVMIISPAGLPQMAHLPSLQVYQATSGFQPDLFDAWFKPTLLRFNPQGKLLAKSVGWSKADFLKLAGLASDDGVQP